MLAETLLILTLAGEARNQGEAGMRAVASLGLPKKNESAMMPPRRCG